jgi:hypothetical protein
MTDTRAINKILAKLKQQRVVVLFSASGWKMGTPQETRGVYQARYAKTKGYAIWRKVCEERPGEPWGVIRDLPRGSVHNKPVSFRELMQYLSRDEIEQLRVAGVDLRADVFVLEGA